MCSASLASLAARAATVLAACARRLRSGRRLHGEGRGGPPEVPARGVVAPRPTDVLKACGVKAADMASSKLMLAEHVPDAA